MSACVNSAGAPSPARRASAAVGEALVACVPELRGEVDALLARIAALHEAAADMPLCPVHGAPHPTAWLLDGERLGLVDFDRLALGHPERDVAALQSAAPELADAFARGFGELDAARLEAYRLERGLAKALRATYDLREDAHTRAARRLRNAAAPP
jgi:aminoglycoside phosphotransferase (APT) family kinase protein